MAVTVLLLPVPGLDGPGHLPQWGSPAVAVLSAFPTGRFCLLGSGPRDAEARGHRNENTAQGLTEVWRGPGSWHRLRCLGLRSPFLSRAVRAKETSALGKPGLAPGLEVPSCA